MAEVGAAEFRKSLKEWIDHVQDGHEVIITERGRPVARVTGIEPRPALDRLVAQGRVQLPQGRRPTAHDSDRVRATGSVSQYVTDERDARRP